MAHKMPMDRFGNTPKSRLTPIMAGLILAVSLAGCTRYWPAQSQIIGLETTEPGPAAVAAPVPDAASPQSIPLPVARYHFYGNGEPSDTGDGSGGDAAMAGQVVLLADTVASRFSLTRVAHDAPADFAIEATVSRRPESVAAMTAQSSASAVIPSKDRFSCKRDIVQAEVVVTRLSDGAVTFHRRATQPVCQKTSAVLDVSVLADALK